MKNKSLSYTLLSLNIAGYMGWLNREKLIINYIEAIKPDFIFLQEVQYDSKISNFDQAKILNSNLREPYKYSNSPISRSYIGHDKTLYREGLACLSRHPIIQSETHVLTKHPDDKHDRIIQTVLIETLNQQLEIINVHFSNNKHSIEQFREVYDFASKYKRWPIIVGDFNIFNLSELRELYKDHYSASTDFKDYISFPSERLTLDYLLLPKKFRFEAIETKESLSDHSAVIYSFSSNNSIAQYK